MHLLAIVTLYLSAVGFGTLLFQYINLVFPDPLVDSALRASGAIRWALASLVIVFPVYIWLSWTLGRELERAPEKRGLRIRKWLLYFTLFAAAVVIIGDLVALLYTFLGGDLSARFVLKVAAVLFVAAVVFGYYLWNLRGERMAFHDRRMRFFVSGIIAIVAVAVVGGFFVVGSPFAERARRFDERRVQDLETIQWQVVSYWQRKGKLPAEMDTLRDEISGFVPPRDPENDVAYEYRTLDPKHLTFELCATFGAAGRSAASAAPQSVPLGPATPENWVHGAGRVCFERTIDAELYKLEKTPHAL